MKIVFLFIFGFTCLVVNGQQELSYFNLINDYLTGVFFPEVVKQGNEHGLNGNIVSSAFSLFPLLGHLALASIGESHDELLKAFGSTNDDLVVDVVKQQRSFYSENLKFASSVYVPADVRVNQTFAQFAKDLVSSEFRIVDFNVPENAAKQINTWVEENTNKKIKNLVQPSEFDLNTAGAVLVNTVYFKGQWDTPFSPNETINKDFHVTYDYAVDVPYLHQLDFNNHYFSKVLNADILKLNYAEDDASLVVVLPNDTEGLPALLKKINASLLNDALDNTVDKLVDLYLPKFTAETSVDLVKVLNNIGVQKIFSPNSENLRRLLESNEPLHVAKAVQKSFISVDENGTEAAVANDAEVSVRSINKLPKPLLLAVDHPFYFELRVGSRITIFNGIVTFDDRYKV